MRVRGATIGAYSFVNVRLWLAVHPPAQLNGNLLVGMHVLTAGGRTELFRAKSQVAALAAVTAAGRAGPMDIQLELNMLAFPREARADFQTFFSPLHFEAGYRLCRRYVDAHGHYSVS